MGYGCTELLRRDGRVAAKPSLWGLENSWQQQRGFIRMDNSGYTLALMPPGWVGRVGERRAQESSPSRIALCVIVMMLLLAFFLVFLIAGRLLDQH